MLSARERLVELWAELALHSPSQARLDTIAVALRKAIAEADETFSRLLRLNPSAVPIIRRYAAFLRDVRAHAPTPRPPLSSTHGSSAPLTCAVNARSRDRSSVGLAPDNILHVNPLSPFGPQVVKDTHSAKRVSDEADDIEQAVAEDSAHKSAQVGSPLSKHAVSHICTA